MSHPALNQAMQQGIAAHKAGDLKTAEACYRRALAVDSGHAEANFLLGCIAHKTGHIQAAVQLMRKAVDCMPGNAHYWGRLATALADAVRFDDAIEAFRKADAIAPEDASMQNNFAAALHNVDKKEEAERRFRHALRLDPQQANTWYNLGNLYESLGRYAEAIEVYERAVQLAPDVAAIQNNLARVYDAKGDVDGAIEHYRKALALNPGLMQVYSNILFQQSYHVLLSPEAMLEAHLAWSRHFGCAERAGLFSEYQAPEAGRRLRIGYVSPDFRQHSVSYFFEPILANHNRSRFEIFCYAELPRADAVSQRLRDLSDGWRLTNGQSDEAVARQIHADGIDVLVDLAGHTAGNRLGVFCYRPAPVQVTYLGYFTTTGLPSMDYWLSDAVLTPPETVERSTEEIWRVPGCCLCYTPPVDAPDVVEQPANGGLVLGSFNDLSKVSPATVSLWAAVMRALPEARLCLKARQLSDPGVCGGLGQAFEREGVSADRLQFLGRMDSVRAHLELYGQVDIALDTIPRTGGTTTVEALWMGVPVATLAGERYIERLSATMLSAVGLDDWVTHDHQSYIARVEQAAHDVVGRQALRKALRGQVRDSALCRGRDLAGRLEVAYEGMIERTRGRGK